MDSAFLFLLFFPHFAPLLNQLHLFSNQVWRNPSLIDWVRRTQQLPSPLALTSTWIKWRSPIPSFQCNKNPRYSLVVIIIWLPSALLRFFQSLCRCMTNYREQLDMIKTNSQYLQWLLICLLHFQPNSTVEQGDNGVICVVLKQSHEKSNGIQPFCLNTAFIYNMQIL